MVTPDVVVEILAENGSKLYDVSIDRGSGQKCYWFQTICHGGDSHKLCYFSESRDFFCYTNCGRMTFYNFIMKIRGIKVEEFYKAIYYVAQKAGISLNAINREGLNSNLRKEVRENIEEINRERDETIEKLKVLYGLSTAENDENENELKNLENKIKIVRKNCNKQKISLNDFMADLGVTLDGMKGK